MTEHEGAPEDVNESPGGQLDGVPANISDRRLRALWCQFLPSGTDWSTHRCNVQLRSAEANLAGIARPGIDHVVVVWPMLSACCFMVRTTSRSRSEVR